jgi:hypothetical protein
MSRSGGNNDLLGSGAQQAIDQMKYELTPIDTYIKTSV